jgi:hypothetical protein
MAPAVASHKRSEALCRCVQPADLRWLEQNSRQRSISMTRAIALGLAFGAMVIATSAQAYKPDVEKCHYEKQCKVVTPYCPPAGQHPKPAPCQGPYTQCKNVKVCVGD